MRKLVPLIIVSVIIVGCTTQPKTKLVQDPNTGEIVTVVETEPDGTVVTETVLDPAKVTEVATVAAPFLGPIGPMMMPLLGLLPLILNKKK